MKFMANLRNSAKEGVDTNDVLSFPTEEGEFVVDSGASMQMVSKRYCNSAELETMRTSRTPTTVMTANGEVPTREEATVYVKELDYS